MRKKLDTRFPASRIKKIMQTDEDVGKIALAVPVLVSKALELFLQDLCDRTYSVTLERGSKTINSLHLKQCVHDFPHYDFLRDIVSKVPDLGTNDTAPPGEDTKPTRRRKAENEENEEDLKRLRGRGRPRGTGRKRRGTIRSTEEDPGTSPALSDEPGPPGPVRDFDLNLDLNEMPPPSEPDEPDRDTKSEEDYPGWSVDEMKKLPADPVQFVLAHQKVDDEEEDYDED